MDKLNSISEYLNSPDLDIKQIRTRIGYTLCYKVQGKSLSCKLFIDSEGNAVVKGYKNGKYFIKNFKNDNNTRHTGQHNVEKRLSKN